LQISARGRAEIVKPLLTGAQFGGSGGVPSGG
jgi:hypothetical protein